MGRSAALALLWVAGALPGWAGRPQAPDQPATGPGGRDYPHAAVQRGHFGSGDSEYWSYTPDQPQPATAPVVVFAHGWSAMQPFPYEAWIYHLVRRGSIVIYPRYQASLRTRATVFTANAAGAVHDALIRLRRAGPVAPDEGKLALVGHSAGGVIVANIAAQWERLKLPRPRAVMCVEPGRSFQPDSAWGIPLATYSDIPGDTLLLCLVGADDGLAGSAIARRIYEGASRVPASSKNLVTAHSDSHGDPPLVTDHSFPTGRSGSGRQLNALDYYACWKLFDALTDAAFYGKHRQWALGNTPEQRSMGKWSDGVAVKELEVK